LALPFRRPRFVVTQAPFLARRLIRTTLRAPRHFFGVPGQEEELELTFNHDGRTYELVTGYGHIAIGVDDLDSTLTALAALGIEPERPAVHRPRGRVAALLRPRPG